MLASACKRPTVEFVPLRERHGVGHSADDVHVVGCYLACKAGWRIDRPRLNAQHEVLLCTGMDQSGCLQQEWMMNGMMDGSGSMMWGMGWSGVLVVAVVVIGAIAIARYLLAKRRL